MPPLKEFIHELSDGSSDEMKRDRDEKKRYLLRKLSFRPSVDDLKNRKVKKLNTLTTENYHLSK